MSNPSKIVKNHGLTYDDVVILPQYSEVISRNDVDTTVEIVKGIKLSTLIVPANMDTVNSAQMNAKISELGGLGNVHQFQTIEDEVEMLVESKKLGATMAATIGASKDFLERARKLIDAGADLIIMDTPHGHSLNMVNGIKEFRKTFGKFPLIAGNIGTGQAVEDLAKAGVDGVKVGIGPGSACLTRINAGAGVPQLTAVMDCFEVAKKHGVSVIADGGIKTAGSFAKAIAAGGTIVMMGGVLAGTDEAPSELVEVNGKKFKKYHGMASTAAKINRISRDHRFEKKKVDYVEGAEGLTAYHGSLENLIQNYMMGLRSAMSYSGAFNVNEYQTKVLLMQVTNSGIVEGGAHGLVQS